MEQCPKCGKWTFGEYIDEHGVKKCLSCGYRENIPKMDIEHQVQRLIKLHELKIDNLIDSEKVIELEKCPKCGKYMVKDKFCDFCGHGRDEYVKRIMRTHLS